MLPASVVCEKFHKLQFSGLLRGLAGVDFPKAEEARRGGGIDDFTEAVALAMVGDGVKKCGALFRRREVEPDEGAADAFAGLTVIKVAEVCLALDALGEECEECAWPLVEVEAEKCGVLEEVAAEWDGAEGEVHGVGDVLPLEAVKIEFA
jgi:hypothetical protein